MVDVTIFIGIAVPSQDTIIDVLLLKPRLHLPRSSYDFSVCDFLYDFVDIVEDRGLRRMC